MKRAPRRPACKTGAEGEKELMSKWTMKKDRELKVLVRGDATVDQIAARMNTIPETIIKTAKRLGISLPPPGKKPDGRLKAKK
jgi:hypothetical protein